VFDKVNVYYLLFIKLEITMQDKANSSSREDEKINLPSQPSNKLMKCLFDICQKLNRVGSPTLHEVNIFKIFGFILSMDYRLLNNYSKLLLEYCQGSFYNIILENI